MIETLNQFFTCFIHPFKTQEYLGNRHYVRETELGKGVLSLASDAHAEADSDDVGLNILEGVSVSWVMVLVKAMYSLLAVNFGVTAYQWVKGESFDASEMAFSSNFSLQKIMIFLLLLEVVFFPLSIWIFTKFWSVVIVFFADLFECEGDVNQKADEIVSNSLVSHLFLLIPIFGQVANRISFLVFLFAGLTKNLRLNTSQALLVIASPLILFLLLLFILAVSVMMLFSIY